MALSPHALSQKKRRMSQRLVDGDLSVLDKIEECNRGHGTRRLHYCKGCPASNMNLEVGLGFSHMVDPFGQQAVKEPLWHSAYAGPHAMRRANPISVS